MVADTVYKNVEDVRKEIHLAFDIKTSSSSAYSAQHVQLDSHGLENDMRFQDVIPDGLDLE